MTKYTYLFILLGSLLPTLALSFDKKVAFYKKWKFLFPAMLLPAVFYIVWDILFTRQAVWSFNPKYVLGVYIDELPLEEVLFFFVVPYCCVFIYECIRCYFPDLKNRLTGKMILQAIALLLLIFIPFVYHLLYSFYTGLFLMLALILHFIFKRHISFFSEAYFLLAYAIILIPFLIVNGLLTNIPVVLYNNAENLGVRIYTIPVEDIFYGMLLIYLNILGYEWLQHIYIKKKNLNPAIH